MIALCVVFYLLWSLVEVQPQLLQPTVTISRSHNRFVYAGTKFVLSSTISLRGNNVSLSSSSLVLDIRWSRGNDIVNSTRTIVSPISGSGMIYTASLTYSPIDISDSGQVNATVTVSRSDESMTASDTEMLTVKGSYLSYQHYRVFTCQCTLMNPLRSYSMGN